MATPAPPPPVPPCLEKWRSEGTVKDLNGMKIFVHESGAKSEDGTGVLIVHGYPGSSWDWQGVVARIQAKTKDKAQPHVVIPDMRGHGLSEKPLDGTYWSHYNLQNVQTDIMQAAAVDAGLESVILVAHDMGQTVGLELMARQEAGTLPFRIRQAILLNGSTLFDMVQMMPSQKKLLESPDEVPEHGVPWDTFKANLAGSYTGKTIVGKPQVLEEILTCQTHQVFINGGDRLQPRIGRYMAERIKKLEHWTKVLFTFQSAPMTVMWGVDDPIAVTAMAERIKKERPYTDLYKLKDVSHWPSIEAPEIIADAIIARLDCA